MLTPCTSYGLVSANSENSREFSCGVAGLDSSVPRHATARTHKPLAHSLTQISLKILFRGNNHSSGFAGYTEILIWRKLIIADFLLLWISSGEIYSGGNWRHKKSHRNYCGEIMFGFPHRNLNGIV